VSRKTLKELHDDIEASLFASQDLPRNRETAIVVTQLEQSLLWCKRALELHGDLEPAP
jgi:hypothetical protein